MPIHGYTSEYMGINGYTRPYMVIDGYTWQYAAIHDNTRLYYSTIMSFYHTRSREGAKYEAVIHCSVLVKPVYNWANTGG